MGKITKMQIEEQEHSVPKVKKILRKKIMKPVRPSKMIVESAPIKAAKIKIKEAKQPKKDIKNISIFRELKKSFNPQSVDNKKLSRGQKRRNLVKSKIIFRKQLQQSITKRKPIISQQKQASPNVISTHSSKTHSLGSDARAKQHTNDINRMKNIMNNNTFIKSPLSSLKKHLTSQIQKKMQQE